MIRNRAFIALAFLLISAPPAYSADQETAPRVSVPFIAKVGEIARYRMERVDTDRDRSEIKGTFISDATFKVLEALPDGYKIALTIDTVDGSMPGLASIGLDKDLISKIGKLSEGLTIVYFANLAGNPLKIENLDEVQTAMNDSLKALQETLGKNSLPAEVRDTVTRLMAAMFKRYADMTGEQAKHLLLDDAATQFALGGIEMRPGEEMQFEQQVPSPFGGAPVKTNNRVWVSGADDRQVTVEMRKLVDPASVKALVENLTQALLQQYGGKVPDEMAAGIKKMETYDLRDTMTTTLRRRDGWPENVTVERVTTMGDTAQVQTRTFTRLN